MKIKPLPPLKSVIAFEAAARHLSFTQAALNGQGLALAWGHLVDHHIASGKLVTPVENVLKTNSKFYLISKSLNKDRAKDIALFLTA